jgi:hypothetical protein
MNFNVYRILWDKKFAINQVMSKFVFTIMHVHLHLFGGRKFTYVMNQIEIVYSDWIS